MKNTHPPLIVNIVIYILAALIGFTLVLLATWADVEAQMYGFYRRASIGLPGLNCPILMTPGEVSKVSLRLTNTTNNLLAPNIRMEISKPAMPFLSTESVKLAAGESKTMEWTIGPENIDLGNFIFINALTYSSYPLPSRESMCGVFIINLPTNGRTIVAIMTILSLLGMGFGLYGLNRSPSLARRFLIARRPLLVLSVLIAVSILVTFVGWWWPGVILLVLTLLLVMAILVLVLMA
jgi:hypothetical protein